MIRSYILVAWLLLATGGTALAQTQDHQVYTLTGIIKSRNAEQLDIQIFNSANELVKTEFADKDGNYSVVGLQSGQYTVKIFRNETLVHTEDIVLQENQVLNVEKLKDDVAEQAIDAVVITKTKAKPFIQREEGKIILNIENSISSAGGTAFEVLEKAPGISVDANDNISLRGKNNIMVQIDGKNSPLSGADLSNYLRGLSSSVIEKIEFITNPSSKYDAAGTSIVNITLKKNQRKGTNGTISTSIGSGKFIKTTNSVSLNHRNNKTNYFMNYSFSYRKLFSNLVLDRNFYKDNGDFEKIYTQDNMLYMDSRNHTTKLGLDYDFNDKNTFGFSFGFVGNNFHPNGDNSTNVLDNNRQLTSYLNTKNNSKNDLNNFSLNLNHKYVLDSLGSDITTDLDYFRYHNFSFQNFDTKTYSPSGEMIGSPYLLQGDIDGGLNIYSLKSDYKKILNNNWKLETGIKTSFVKSDNNLLFYNRSSGSPIVDDGKTNHFIYEENINAVYGNISRKWNKFNSVFGLRIENTNVTGTQLITNEVNKKKYTQLFPSLLLSYELNDNNSLEANFSRRISRPSYQQLNPFKYYLDPTTYKTGNPYLNPQTTQSYEFTYGYKGKYFATFSYNKTLDNITDVLKPKIENGENVTVQTIDNLESATFYGLYIIAPFKISSWWNTSNNINFYYGTYTGNVSNTDIKDEGNFTLTLNSTHQFKFGNEYSAELSAMYQGREIYAFMDVEPQWQLNIGVMKKLGKSGTLKFSFNDIFWGTQLKAQTKYNRYIENFHVKRDTRIAMLTYSYTFGSSKNSPRKTGGADDLQKRAGG